MVSTGLEQRPLIRMRRENVRNIQWLRAYEAQRRRRQQRYHRQCTEAVCGGPRRCTIQMRWYGIVATAMLATLTLWHYVAVLQEKEAPLDHLVAVLQKPWFALTCPDFAVSTSDSVPRFPPPAFMIRARPMTLVKPVLSSWTNQGWNVTDISTIQLSQQLDPATLGCRFSSWKTRLFAVYQDAFRQLLREHSHATHFVVIEDDAALINGSALMEEYAWAVQESLDYYSFFPTAITTETEWMTTTSNLSFATLSAGNGSRVQNATDISSTCVYDHGTVAQVFSKGMMQRIVHADRMDVCRLPIDMYIAQRGPWYVTRRQLVRHVSKRRFQLPSATTLSRLYNKDNSNTNNTTRAIHAANPNRDKTVRRSR